MQIKTYDSIYMESKTFANACKKIKTRVFQNAVIVQAVSLLVHNHTHLIPRTISFLKILEQYDQRNSRRSTSRQQKQAERTKVFRLSMVRFAPQKQLKTKQAQFKLPTYIEPPLLLFLFVCITSVFFPLSLNH